MRGFKIYFTPLVGVLFIVPSRYLSTIGQRLVFRLGRWSSRIQTGFLVSRPTQDSRGDRPVSGTGLSPSLARLPRRFPCLRVPLARVLQPRRASAPVWPLPLSLAATDGISGIDFSSSGYLDVSVPPVRPPRASFSPAGRRPLRRRGFPIRKSSGHCMLGCSPKRIAPLQTSFIAFRCQDIHHAPFVALKSQVSSKMMNL